jgi:hypothetical protein
MARACFCSTFRHLDVQQYWTGAGDYTYMEVSTMVAAFQETQISADSKARLQEPFASTEATESAIVTAK